MERGGAMGFLAVRVATNQPERIAMSYQPAPPVGAPGPTPPPNYLVWSILATIFCCLPFGIPAIVFAAQVNSKFMIGDYAGAQESSKKAKTWTIVAAVSGAVVVLLYLIFMIAFIGTIGSLDDFESTTY